MKDRARIGRVAVYHTSDHQASTLTAFCTKHASVLCFSPMKGLASLRAWWQSNSVKETVGARRRLARFRLTCSSSGGLLCARGAEHDSTCRMPRGDRAAPSSARADPVRNGGVLRTLRTGPGHGPSAPVFRRSTETPGRQDLRKSGCACPTLCGSEARGSTACQA